MTASTVARRAKRRAAKGNSKAPGTWQTCMSAAATPAAASSLRAESSMAPVSSPWKRDTQKAIRRPLPSVRSSDEFWVSWTMG